MANGAFQQHRRECRECTDKTPCFEGIRILREAMAAKASMPSWVCPSDCLTCTKFKILGYEDWGGGYVRPVTTCESCPVSLRMWEGQPGLVRQGPLDMNGSPLARQRQGA